MKLPITSRQAQYLNDLKMAAGEYRKSCKQVSDQALADIDNMDKGYHHTGPSHQRIFELQVNYGKLEALLKTTFLIFNYSHLEGDERRESLQNVNDWVKTACSEESESFGLYFQSIDEGM
jgi:hypothetical protein